MDAEEKLVERYTNPQKKIDTLIHKNKYQTTDY